MSDKRGDCDHGHAAEVLELARLIGGDHDVAPVDSGALVVVPESAHQDAFVIGVFNTTGLWRIAAAVLKECAEHKPDGCVICDASALAAKDALLILRARFEFYMKGGKR